MCGLFGVISDAPVDVRLLKAAEALQRHRGPDAQRTQCLEVGAWHVGLAHQRLAILDLSEAGTQPMVSPSGRSLIAHNGEVYNYLELRAELAARGVQFRTRTDTEVIAAACEIYGPEAALQKLNGMWAFVWIDLNAQRVVLARDRFGVKPLYLCALPGRLAFASEIKTLVRGLGLRSSINKAAVATYLRAQQQDTGEDTFFASVTKLPAGHFAELVAGAGGPRVRLQRYWQLQIGLEPAADEPTAVEQVRALLADATRLRLRSDVPVGLLLSGGLDSSAIAALASGELGGQGDLSFIAAVSDDPDSDESAFIRLVAQHLQRPVQEVRLEFPRDDILALIARVTEQCDEPLSGFSCVAQNLLMQRARDTGVTVLLSGQGADEVFCGYRKYAAFQLQSLLRQYRWRAAAGLLGGFVRERTVVTQLNLAEARRYLPRILRALSPAICGPALAGAPLLCAALGSGIDVRERQRADVESLSIPALTHWEDRNSMAWSREVRNPFLDYRLVELGVNLPMALKVRGGWTKYVLRRALQEQLPPAIAWRRDKRGFSTPEARLLRNELRASVHELLGPPAEMVRRGLVDASAARARFDVFLERSPPWRQAVASRDIFQLLSLELWLRAYRENLSD